MTTEDLGRLRHLPFLRGVDEDVLRALLEAAHPRLFAPGEVILDEGSTGQEMYLVISGSVEIVKGRGTEAVVLATRGPGELVGEMGLIDASARSATVRALESARLLAFGDRELNSFWIRQPLLLRRVIQTLTGRLRQADLQIIEDLQRKNAELARAYGELKEAQAALVEKERMQRELELARQVQQSILPRVFPQVPGYSFAAQSHPAREVGGDYYDCFALPRGRVGLVVADVSDKGMPAALYMALARSLLRAEARRNPSPRRVLMTTHSLLLEMGEPSMFLTAFYGVLDPSSRVLTYARAGHDCPLLFSRSRQVCQELTGAGMLLGLIEHISLDEVTVPVAPGDVLVLYTDGITEANSPEGEFFGLDRLREAVSSASSASADEICRLIFERVGRFQQAAPQHDDMAVLVARADLGLEPNGGIS